MLAIQNEFEGVFAEVANWLDGTPVESDEHMRAVDSLLAAVKDAARMAKDAKEAEYRPHKAACDAVVTRWKAFLDDLDRQAKGLAAAASDYKRKREAERQAAEREARAEAERKKAEAEAAARAASKNDIEAQREAAALAREAAQAQGKIAELRAEIIVGAGAGKGPLVRTYSEEGKQQGKEFVAYQTTRKNGAIVRAADVDFDGRSDIAILSPDSGL
jgi:chemotaxis protein histidine kinase CheA